MIRESGRPHIHACRCYLLVQGVATVGAASAADRGELHDHRPEHRNGAVSFYGYKNFGGDWDASSAGQEGENGRWLERFGSDDGLVWRVCSLQQYFS